MACLVEASRPLLYDEALVTSLCRYGESDCIVRLFTRSFGRINAFFKRGFLPQRQGQGALIALGPARVALIINNNKMPKLYSIDPDARCLLLASSLKLFAYSSYIAELIEKLLPEQEILEPVFDLMLESYDALLAHGVHSCVLRSLELKLLEYLGYLPELPLDTRDYFYDPSACFFIDETRESAFSVTKHAVALARAMLKAPVATREFYELEEPEELMMIARIFHERLKLLGLLPLKSLGFFKQMRLEGKISAAGCGQSSIR